MGLSTNYNQLVSGGVPTDFPPVPGPSVPIPFGFPYGSRMGIDGEGTWGFSIAIGSMVLLYMVSWIPSIYPSHVTIYSSTMDPSWDLFLNGNPLLLGKECLWT